MSAKGIGTIIREVKAQADTLSKELDEFVEGDHPDDADHAASYARNEERAKHANYLADLVWDLIAFRDKMQKQFGLKMKEHAATAPVRVSRRNRREQQDS
jgi:hypothetical protein